MKIDLGGLPLLLFLIFLILKLTKYIDWSWWWVSCPLWIMPLFVILALALIIFIKAIQEALK